MKFVINNFMKESRLSAIYAWRLLKREWQRFVLPLVSLTFTAVVLLLVLLLTDSSRLFLENQAAELLGGDVEIESVYPVAIDEILAEAGVSPTAESKHIHFSATIEAASGAQAVEMVVVDESFPLYGEIGLASGQFKPLQGNEMYLTKAAAERMEAVVGETIRFGEGSFVVAGIIVSEPASLLAGFRFLPRVFIAESGLTLAALDLALLRAEYEYMARFATPLSDSQIESLTVVTEAADLDADFAGTDGGRLVRGLGQVTEFLMIAVLATAVLATVNVYASTLYLLTAWRRSFAVLVALGMRRRFIVLMVSLALGYVVLLSVALGVLLAVLAFNFVRGYGLSAFTIELPWPDPTWGIISTALVLGAVALGSLLPALRDLLTLSPRQVLSGGEVSEGVSLSINTLFRNAASALLPLIILSVSLLQSWWKGLVILLGIVLVYGVVATVFHFCLAYVYKRRERLGFILKTIVAEKKADGLFGVISFTSLFMGLLSVAVVVLVQVSLERYLAEDLSTTVPSVYVLDVQPSQKAELQTQFPELTLFANIGARLTHIDDISIEEELAKPDTTMTRELGREFSLTFGEVLPEGEVILSGDLVIGLPGTVSVDAEFAGRANIVLGSELEFTIQGFPVTVTVTNLRQTDSRSGLPFFYFILAPADVAQFPAVYFGYTYYDETARAELGQYVARTMPNISVLDTAELGPVLVRIIGTLLIIVYAIAVPPLVIAVLLIATLVVLSYASRRREGARLRALGATKALVRRLYLLESSSLSIVAAGAAYAVAVGITTYLVLFFMELPTVALFAPELLLGAGVLFLLVLGLGYYLFTSDRVPLRQLLAYEDGH